MPIPERGTQTTRFLREGGRRLRGA